MPFDGWDRAGRDRASPPPRSCSRRNACCPAAMSSSRARDRCCCVVAKSIVEGGGRVVAVVDAQPRRAWCATCAALASRPDLVARGLRLDAHAAQAPACRCCMRHALRSVGGTARDAARTSSRRSTATAVPSSVALEFDCDAVCCGFGLMPATDVTRLAGRVARLRRDARRLARSWSTTTSAATCPRLYVAGDGAGVAGAAAAPWQGRIAALSRRARPAVESTQRRSRSTRRTASGRAIARRASALR